MKPRIDAWAWAEPGEAERVDGSIRVRVRGYVIWMHLSIERVSPGLWRFPITEAQVDEIITEMRRRPGNERVSRYDARWLLASPPPDTEATRYGHPARQRLDRDLALGSAGWMQDWPLEVARPARLDEFLAYYEQADSDEVRHDAMWLALYAAKGQLPPAPRWEWFDARLRQRFPLHAHAVFQLGCHSADGFGGRLYALGLSVLRTHPLCLAS